MNEWQNWTIFGLNFATSFILGSQTTSKKLILGLNVILNHPRLGVYPLLNDYHTIGILSTIV